MTVTIDTGDGNGHQPFDASGLGTADMLAWTFSMPWDTTEATGVAALVRRAW